MIKNDVKLAIIGLGYVGLPLALEFSKKRPVLGYDINNKRIKELKAYKDSSNESKSKEIRNAKRLKFTSSYQDLKYANCYIIAVPTPIDKHKQPDLNPLLSATKMVGSILKKGDVVIYESTVFPGCTEENCVPILEQVSGLRFNKSFFCGYSPERINPGDKKHKISQIIKITSGSNLQTAKMVDNLYKEIISAGTYRAESIKVAESAKVIENTQRDLNIALINEFSIILNKLNIDTQSVLKAASSKWNFLKFYPGLVGGHCIGVDPYYLTYKSQSIGYQAEVILSGRKINDNMGFVVASNLLKMMIKKSINLKKARILIMGLTFKENCSDLRNSGVYNVIKEIQQYNCKLDLYDPEADSEEVKKIYGITPLKRLLEKKYDGIIISVAHDKFKIFNYKKILSLCKKKNVIYDLKYLLPQKKGILRL